MKNQFLTVLFVFAIIVAGTTQNLKPYLGAELLSNDFDQAKEMVSQKMASNGLALVGQYRPAKDYERWVFVYTTKELEETVNKYGGFRGFALTQRIALTKRNGNIFLSATNPKYWGAAYFQEDFDKEVQVFIDVEEKLKSMFRNLGISESVEFGAEEGLYLDKLKNYQYMFGMPYFKDVIELGEFSDFETIKANIKKGLRMYSDDYKFVYSVENLDKKIALYGIGLFGAEGGEQLFLPIIDFNEQKHTCFLPYEILVLDNKVYMLHGRYRIALSFPDLTMGTFSKIMSTPGDIEDALRKVVNP